MKRLNIKKFVRSMTIILSIIFIISLILTKNTLSHKEIEYGIVYVANGDTLWNIATELKQSNDYYKSKDIRDIIIDLKKINNLKSSNIYINQELLIPVV